MMILEKVHKVFQGSQKRSFLIDWQKVIYACVLKILSIKGNFYIRTRKITIGYIHKGRHAYSQPFSTQMKLKK